MKGKIAQARGARAGAPRVALLIETSREFGRGLLRGILAYERRHGPWGLHVMPGDLAQVLPAMRVWQGTGIIARVTTPALERAVRASGLPFIGVSLTQQQVASGGPLAGASHVRTAEEAISQVAAEHLLERGFRHFAFVGEVGNTEWSRLREQATARLLVARGLSCQVYPRPPEAERDWGRECRRLARWLRALSRPVGIVAPTDLRGRQVIEACREAGLRVPEDAAVIGVDNDPLLCALCDPPLTSVALDVERAGWEAAQLLDRLMSGQGVAPATIWIRPTHVVARHSTATAHARDTRVAAARQFIFKHSGRLIQVRDVVEHAGLSRRSLEVHFRADVGRSVLAEIRRVRLEHATTLLRDTNAPVADIAAVSGFASPNYLAKVFRRLQGISPRAFREQNRL